MNKTAAQHCQDERKKIYLTDGGLDAGRTSIFVINVILLLIRFLALCRLPYRDASSIHAFACFPIWTRTYTLTTAGATAVNSILQVTLSAVDLLFIDCTEKTNQLFALSLTGWYTVHPYSHLATTSSFPFSFHPPVCPPLSEFPSPWVLPAPYP